MAPIPPRTFAGLLRGLSTAEFASFVADLWRRRGWETRVEGEAVVLTAADGTTRRLLVRHERGRFRRSIRRLRRGRDPIPDGSAAAFDAVVTSARTAAGRAGGRPVIDADDLRRAALYAVDREAREALFASHFDRSPTVATASGRGVPVSVTTAGLLVLLGIVLVGLVAGSAGLFESGPSRAGAPSAADDVGPTVTPARPATTTVTATLEPGTPLSGTLAYPPGLSRSGVTDAEALARTHLFVLASQSYRWTITYREVVDGEVQGTRSERVAVENATVYRSTVNTTGTVVGTTRLVSDVSTYADGDARYDRRVRNGTVTYRRHDLGTGRNDTPPFADHPWRVITWYLSVQESEVVNATVRNGTRFYRVRGTGDDWYLTKNVTVSATVDEYGIVRQLRRSHEPPGTELRIVVTFRVQTVRNATVTPPPWYEEARRATG